MRTILAQPIQYMLELDVKYGWISTYEQSIFLRQTFEDNSWRIEYSAILFQHKICSDGWWCSPCCKAVCYVSVCFGKRPWSRGEQYACWSMDCTHR